jgi:hypothetical protein
MIRVENVGFGWKKFKKRYMNSLKDLNLCHRLPALNRRFSSSGPCGGAAASLRSATKATHYCDDTEQKYPDDTAYHSADAKAGFHCVT